MKHLPVRKNIRLKDYDYSQPGYYFVTICTVNRIAWLGDVNVGQGLCSCRLSEIGNMVEIELRRLGQRYDNLNIDKYVIMPNHVHAIIVLTQRREQSPRPTTTLVDIVCVLKSITTKTFNKMNNTSGKTLWQSRFHDHIIRNDEEYQRLWQYIDENPARWNDDCYHA